MFALAESVQNSLVIGGASIAVALVGAVGSALVLLVKAGRRGKRVDDKTDELRPNHGTSLADRVAVIGNDVLLLGESVKSLTENSWASALRHQENRDSIHGLVAGQKEIERRIADYQIMSSGARATSNERLLSMQRDLAAHMNTHPPTGETLAVTKEG